MGRGPFLVRAKFSDHARMICLGITVQALCHFEWSGPVSVLEGRMCFVWCGVVCGVVVIVVVVC